MRTTLLSTAALLALACGGKDKGPGGEPPSNSGGSAAATGSAAPPNTGSGSSSAGSCVATCVQASQMKAVSPAQIQADCERECSASTAP